MSNFKKLTEAGAQCVAGVVILNKQVMGNFVSGDLHLTPEGREYLGRDYDGDTEDVAPAPKPSRRKAKQPAPDPVDTVETVTEDGGLDTLDDLIA